VREGLAGQRRIENEPGDQAEWQKHEEAPSLNSRSKS
jgi:hypothetical protein